MTEKKSIKYYLEDIKIFSKYKLHNIRKAKEKVKIIYKTPMFYEFIGFLLLFVEAKIGIIFIIFGMLYSDYKTGEHRNWNTKIRPIENEIQPFDEQTQYVLSEFNRIMYRIKNLKEEVVKNLRERK